MTGALPLSETDARALASLTPRERDVLVLAAKGLTIREIAQLAGLTHWTANDHLKSIHRKLDVGNRVEAAVIAAKAGLV